MNTAQILRELRERKKLSQTQVAAALGIDRTTYVKYESGNSIKRNLQKIADYYEVSTDFLLGRSTQRNAELSKHSGHAINAEDTDLPVLSTKEEEYLLKYRTLAPGHKNTIDLLLNHFYDADTAEEEVQR